MGERNDLRRLVRILEQCTGITGMRSRNAYLSRKGEPLPLAAREHLVVAGGTDARVL